MARCARIAFSRCIGYVLRIVASRPSSALRVALAVVVLVVAGACSDDEDGEPVIDLGSSAIGTCLDVGDTVGADIERLPVVPCEEPHSHEIFAVFDSAADSYPGFDALEAEAQALCLGAFEEYVGISAFDSDLFYSWLVPTLTSWDKNDDTEIVCVAGEDNDAPLVGSVEGLAR